MSQPVFSERELLVIQSALATVMPIGGGSEIFTLYRKIREATQVSENAGLVARMSQTVIDEWKESQI